MPLTGTVILDTLQRASITDSYTDGSRVVRSGIIKIDSGSVAGMDADAIFAAVSKLPGIPPFHDYYPGAPYNDFWLTGKYFEPFENNPRKIRVILTYERAGLPEAVVTFILQRETTMVDTVTELHPSNMQTMTVTWIRYKNVLGVNIPVEAVARTARMRYRVPYQRVTATGYYRDGAPPAAMLGALGTVNDNTWRGLAKGYWLYASQSDVTRDKGASYSITLGFETQLRRDWSTWEALEDVNGRVLTPDPADVATLLAAPYTYGVSYGNGITKAGLYPLASFGTIFPWGLP